MRSGALGDAQLGGAGLDAIEAGLDESTEVFAGAAEDGVAERVGAGSVGAEVVAGGVLDAFGDDDEAMTVALEDFFDAADEVVGVEGDFREQHDVRRGVVVVGVLDGLVFTLVATLREDGRGGEPAGVAAHDFKDRDEVVLAHGGVIESGLTDGHADVLGDGAEAGAVVGQGKVVVDGLRHADDTEFVAALLGEGVDLGGGVLGVIATDVVEVADVVRFEDLEDAVKVFGLLHLVAAGAEGGAWGVAESAEGLLGFGGEVDELFVEDALDTIETTVDLDDFVLMLEGFRDHPGEAGVDDGGRTAALRDEKVANEGRRHGSERVEKWVVGSPTPLGNTENPPLPAPPC